MRVQKLDGIFLGKLEKHWQKVSVVVPRRNESDVGLRELKIVRVVISARQEQFDAFLCFS
jgi:hypothetical protein